MIPRTRAISEPYPLVYLVGLRNRGIIGAEQEKRLISTAFKVTAKIEQLRSGGKYENIVFKLARICQPQIPMVRECFPGARIIFTTRNPKDSIESWLKIGDNLKRSLFFRYGLRPAVFNHLSLPYEPPGYRDLLAKYFSRRWTMPIQDMFAISYTGSLQCYLLNKGCYDLAVTYEELTRDIPVKCRRLNFELPLLPQSFFQDYFALLIFLFDSPGNWFLAGRHTPKFV